MDEADRLYSIKRRQVSAAAAISSSSSTPFTAWRPPVNQAPKEHQVQEWRAACERERFEPPDAWEADEANEQRREDLKSMAPKPKSKQEQEEEYAWK